MLCQQMILDFSGRWSDELFRRRGSLSSSPTTDAARAEYIRTRIRSAQLTEWTQFFLF